MINILNKLPNHDQEFGVAVSGGIDSMVVLDFLIKGGRKPFVFYFDHGTKHGDKAKHFLIDYCDENDLWLEIDVLNLDKPNKMSLEEHWRNSRYEFFSKFDHLPIITAHHLDDCIETWLFSCMNGMPKVIPYRRHPNIIRPFLLNEKQDFIDWVVHNDVPWIEDESNQSMKHMRNRIRHRIVPEVKKINKGIAKTVRKIVLEQNKE